MIELILASTSPRRRQLLMEHGFAHRAVPPGIDDAPLHASPETPPAMWTAALALLKGRAAVDQMGPEAEHALVLAADTIVVKNGIVLGQPMTDDQARSTLKLLDHGTHDVMTGVALIAPDQTTLFTDEARVTVGTLGEDRIERYIASGGWRGKAGAYNLMERLADGWPITYTGDPATIMGLPMQRLTPILRRLMTSTNGDRP